jgi:hypothetical protein
MLAPRYSGEERGLEVDMPISQKASRSGGKAFAFPLLGIVLLLAFYWILTEWHDVPRFVDGALASVHWPR